MSTRTGLFFTLSAFVFLTSSTSASAQSWSFDARSIALGGGSGSNLATEMVEEQQTYRAIVLPFGLLQVLSDIDKFDPSSDQFDLVRAVEYAASPLHFVVGRGTTSTGEAFITDIRNAGLNRDLNAYRGFAPSSELRAEGLSAPSYGKTFFVSGDRSGAFHGIRIGAGPYLSTTTVGFIDPQLIDVLASSTPVAIPNKHFVLTDNSQGQIALAITGGYRGRIAWPIGVGGGSEREGLYVAADYNYLHGFRLEDFGMTVNLDTDGSGLITILPATTPIAIQHVSAKSGQGMAVDVGVTAVISQWELGVGANGLGNRINWTSVEQETFTLTSLVTGDGEFVESPTTLIGDRRIELPVDYRGSVAFNADAWSAVSEVGHGFLGTSFHGGLERRFDRIELRGGARYINEKWNPTGGVGFNLSPRVSIDVAAFGTTANVERKRQLAIAASLRLNRPN